MYTKLTNSIDHILAFSTLSTFKYILDYIYSTHLTYAFYSCLKTSDIIENEVSGFTKFKYVTAHFLNRIDVYDLKIGSNIASKIDLLTRNEVFDKHPEIEQRIKYYEDLYNQNIMYCTQYSNEFFALSSLEILPLIGLLVIGSNNLFEIVDA